MLRKATARDGAAIDAFLKPHTETSMFLRSNLAAHGIGSDHRNGTSYYLHEAAGAINAVFGRTNAGFLLCQMPQPSAELAAAFVEHIKDLPLLGITGHAGQVPFVTDALGYPEKAWKMAKDEPLYALNLKDLQSADDVSNLRFAAPKDRAILLEWFQQNEVDTAMSTDPSAIERRALQQTEAAITGKTVQLLEENGVPIAMTAFNARLPDVVQIGGVFVRRDRRNEGIGRRIVAAQLLKVVAEGVEKAILFAVSPQAARAYESIGFVRIGSYRLCLIAD